MATLSKSSTGGVEARIDDYLDDKLQTLVDLDSLDALIENVHRQQALLKQQLEEARKNHNDNSEAASSREAAVQIRSDGLQQRQADIESTLKSMTQTDSGEDASRAFSASMGKLRQLEVTSGYIDLLQEVDKLGEEARLSFKTSPSTALPPYVRMRSLLLAVRTAQNDTEEARPFLMNQVAKHATELYKDIEKQLKEDMLKTLAEMEWPKKEMKLLPAVLEQFEKQVDLLLELQKPDLQENAEEEVPHAIPLLPMEVLVEPLALRFRYHFYGEKPTNRLDKPEYFLSHILDLLDQHATFMTDYMQPIIDVQNRKSNVADALFTDAVSAFITALLPMLTSKCLQLLSQIADQPQLLSHLVHELMVFDKTLVDNWGYQPTTDLLRDWKGLTWDILNTHGYFSPWLMAEKDFALSRYKSIRDSPDGGNIDFDATELRTTKPTKGAIRVNDLLETVTDRYRNLSSFSYKLRFLMDVQIEIFDDYHNYLLGGLQAFTAASLTGGRLLQGQATSDNDVSGMKGLETLAKVFGSAEYLEDKMSDWSNELFFLELWDDLQERVKGRDANTRQVGRDLTVEHVASKTSSTINSTSQEGESIDDGALFDETASSYRRLKETAETDILRALEKDVKSSSATFSRSAQWSTISSGGNEPADLAPSSSLDPTLQVLSSQLAFLATVLGVASLNKVVRQVCLVLEREIFENVILRHSFSLAGVAQLRRDILAIETTVDSASRISGIAKKTMLKLFQALKLLGLPVASAVEDSDGKTGDGWGFEEDEQTSADSDSNVSDEVDEKDVTFDKVSGRVFQSNAAARRILETIGCDLLSEKDARKILERRIDANI